MTGPARAFRLWPYLLGILLGLCVGLALFIYLGARHIDDRTRQWVITELSSRFDSQVELQSLHVETTPRMQVTGEGLTLRYRNRTDVPPLIQIARFSFNLGVLGIIHVPRHVKGVYVENMVITIPPSDPNATPPPPKRSAPVPQRHLQRNRLQRHQSHHSSQESRQRSSQFRHPRSRAQKCRRPRALRFPRHANQRQAKRRNRHQRHLRPLERRRSRLHARFGRLQFLRCRPRSVRRHRRYAFLHRKIHRPPQSARSPGRNRHSEFLPRSGRPPRPAAYGIFRHGRRHRRRHLPPSRPRHALAFPHHRQRQRHPRLRQARTHHLPQRLRTQRPPSGHPSPRHQIHRTRYDRHRHSQNENASPSRERESDPPSHSRR